MQYGFAAMTEDTPHTVYLYVYDLSQGMARQLSPLLLGKQASFRSGPALDDLTITMCQLPHAVKDMPLVDKPGT